MARREIDVTGRESVVLNLRRDAVLTLVAESPDGFIAEESLAVDVLTLDDCAAVDLGAPTATSRRGLQGFALHWVWDTQDKPQVPRGVRTEARASGRYMLRLTLGRRADARIWLVLELADSAGQTQQQPAEGGDNLDAAWATRAQALRLVIGDRSVDLPGPAMPIWDRPDTQEPYNVRMPVSEPLVGSLIPPFLDHAESYLAGTAVADRRIQAVWCWFDEDWPTPSPPTVRSDVGTLYELDEDPDGKSITPVLYLRRRVEVALPRPRSILQYAWLLWGASRASSPIEVEQALVDADGVVLSPFGGLAQFSFRAANPAHRSAAVSSSMTLAGPPATASHRGATGDAPYVVLSVTGDRWDTYDYVSLQFQYATSSGFANPTTLAAGTRRTPTLARLKTYWFRARWVFGSDIAGGFASRWGAAQSVAVPKKKLAAPSVSRGSPTLVGKAFADCGNEHTNPEGFEYSRRVTIQGAAGTASIEIEETRRKLFCASSAGAVVTSRTHAGRSRTADVNWFENDMVSWRVRAHPSSAAAGVDPSDWVPVPITVGSVARGILIGSSYMEYTEPLSGNPDDPWRLTLYFRTNRALKTGAKMVVTVGGVTLTSTNPRAARSDRYDSCNNRETAVGDYRSSWRSGSDHAGATATLVLTDGDGSSDTSTVKVSDPC